MLMKFSGTLPAWTSRAPFSHNVGENLYTYTMHDSGDPYEIPNEKKLDDLKLVDLLLR